MKFDQFIKRLCSDNPLLAVLVDPDKFNGRLIALADSQGVDCFLVGGSVLKKNNTGEVVKKIKALTEKPVILFPGDERQLTARADGMLLLSLLSGRNPEYLVEKHVRAAPLIRKMKLPHLPTAYLLISSGKPSATQKITRTRPLHPSDLPTIKNTSIAGEQLGFKAIYLEAGSGATDNVPVQIVNTVKKAVHIPVIVGGGIDSALKATRLINAGADMIVVGNALEKNMNLIKEIAKAFKK